MSPDNDPKDPLTTVPAAIVEFDADELRNAALGFLASGQRLLKALANGAVLEVEVGAGKPLRLAVKERRADEREA